MKYAYTTLISTDNYTWGAICLALSFKNVNSKYPFIFMINEKVSKENVQLIQSLNLGQIKIIPNNLYPLTGEYNQYQCTFQKFEVFNLTDYERICFLDADCIILSNFDEELETYPFLFTKRKDGQLCGEVFIITPHVNLYNLMIKYKNNFQTDEQQLKTLVYREDFFSPNDKLIACAGHMGDNSDFLANIQKPDKQANKYWQRYHNINLNLATKIVNYIQNKTKI